MTIDVDLGRKATKPTNLPMLFKLFDYFKNMTARWRNQFYYVNIGETFFLSGIARPSKKDNTSCLKSVAREP